MSIRALRGQRPSRVFGPVAPVALAPHVGHASRSQISAWASPSQAITLHFWAPCADLTARRGTVWGQPHMERSLLLTGASESHTLRPGFGHVESTLNAARTFLPRPHPGVVFRSVSDGAVLLHMEHEVYFGLNAVGAQVWLALPPASKDLDDLCARLAAAYPDVGADVLRADIAGLLQALRESHLVLDAE